MTAASLVVERAGPLVSVQDAGRAGAMRFGVPHGGPMDRLAHGTANAAVGNDPGAAAIEVSRGGVGLRAEGGDVVVGVVGPSFHVAVGGRSRASWAVHRLRAGATLEVRVRSDDRRGAASHAWAYVAVAGGVEARSWLGSRSTHVATGLGGALLEAGLRLSVSMGGDDPAPERLGAIPTPPRSGVDHDGQPFLRVVAGPQQDRFADGAMASLLDATWTVTDRGDRMGTRLDGPRLGVRDALSIPSSPIVRGALQVAGDGVATLLHADHQTTGGYPRIATVVDADLDRAAQLPPGTRLRFGAVHPEEAVALAREDAAARSAHLDLVAAPGRTLGHRLRRANLVAGVVLG